MTASCTAFETGSETSTATSSTTASRRTTGRKSSPTCRARCSTRSTIRPPPSLDYSNPQYAHNFFVDATPGTGDLYYSGAWHTWLVGGLGAGGAAIYALDITNPSLRYDFTEANAATVVKGEWSSATITCVNVGACGISLGNTYGTPQIRRFHDGNWGAVFGNGYGSTSGDAGIYVMIVSDPTGADHASTT